MNNTAAMQAHPAPRGAPMTDPQAMTLTDLRKECDA
jgi:hypothetical protein